MAPKALLIDIAAGVTLTLEKTIKVPKTVEKKANKCITDNYKGDEWDFEATHVRKVDGVTLFEEVCQDIEASATSGIKFVAGKNYNLIKKEKFSNPKRAQMADALDDLIDEALDLRANAPCPQPPIWHQVNCPGHTFFYDLFKRVF